jgi:(p)ppGpp synthase/HD superfamily hydrolase
MWSQDTYMMAYLFAAEAHLGQRWPGSELPYLAHVGLVSIEVIAALAAEPVRDGDLAVQCALLHDVIEDTGVTYTVVEERFGKQVAAGVQALSKDPALPHAEQMADSLRRIRLQPHEVWMVKLADRIANLQSVPAHWSAAKIAAYRSEAEQIYAVLGGASPFLADRLRAKIAAYG